ncbi:MAG: folate-binding protein YgfZ [Proteobacteria bacterium]|nr:folate-binding protein YgfZ [Pseudomonadota bacterium]
MSHAAILSDRAVVAVTGAPARAGAEARAFLQGLVSSDMDALKPGKALYAALLTPQGKILFDFLLIGAGDNTILIDCARDRAADLIKRLTLYRLRAKLEITARPDLAVAAQWPEGPSALPDEVYSFSDPRLLALGWRMVGPPETLRSLIGAGEHVDAGDPVGAGEPLSAYHAHRLSLGVPDSADLPPDTLFALDAGFEELNGVNFHKGCFVGQEVTARMKHRSSARKRMLIAEIAPPLPPPGTAIRAGEREIGTLASGQDGTALALVRLDRLAEAEAAGTPITVDGKPATLKKPSWLGV